MKARTSNVVPMTAPRKVSEDMLQASIVKAYRTLFDCIIFAVPNGGNRNPREAAKLKWTGTLKGVTDLVVLGRNGQVMFIECKTEKGRESPEQTAFLDAVWERGFRAHVVRDLDTAIAVGRAFGLEAKRPLIRTIAETGTGF